LKRLQGEPLFAALIPWGSKGGRFLSAFVCSSSSKRIAPGARPVGEFVPGDVSAAFADAVLQVAGIGVPAWRIGMAKGTRICPRTLANS
jgi:hypothetical protein